MWWTLSDEALKEMLVRAYRGEDPELLAIELYANSDIETVEGD